MTYVALALFLAGLGLGVGVTYKVEHAAVERLETAIRSGNEKAASLLAGIHKSVETAENKAVLSNLELDHANTSFINTANAYDQRLDAAISLYRAKRTACPVDTVPKGDHPDVPETAAAAAEPETEFARLLRAKSRECDEAANYALNAYKFVFEQNCGVSR